MNSMKSKQCLWCGVPKRETAYCHLFDHQCKNCLFSRQSKAPEETSLWALTLPDKYFLSRQHLWIAPGSDGRLLVGIDDFVAEALFHVRSIIQPGIQSRVKAGAMIVWIIDLFGTLSLRSPVTGTIVACNDELGEHPELVRNAPYGAGWLFELYPEGQWQEPLLTSSEGKQWIARAKHQLKDRIVRVHGSKTSETLLTDGGNLSLPYIIETMPKVYLQLLAETMAEDL